MNRIDTFKTINVLARGFSAGLSGFQHPNGCCGWRCFFPLAMPLESRMTAWIAEYWMNVFRCCRKF